MPKQENLFRPQTLNDFLGQKEIIKRLKIFIYSAKKRKTVLDHLLFYGPPGLGKTTLAQIIANEMGTNLFVVTAASLEKIVDIISILGQLNAGDILFIDEIHRLKKEVTEILYGAMEDFKVYVTYKSEENTKAITMNVSPFSLIGATTNAGYLTAPLRDRFAITFKFNYYNENELSLIAKNIAKLFNLTFDETCYLEIAKRSRFTPRILINHLKKIYDYAIYKNLKEINYFQLNKAFKYLKIYRYGLNDEDILIIKVLYERFLNQPTSLETIASCLNENVNNLKIINEPFLVMSSIIDRTKRGRILTKKGQEIYQKIIEEDNGLN